MIITEQTLIKHKTAEDSMCQIDSFELNNGNTDALSNL